MKNKVLRFLMIIVLLFVGINVSAKSGYGNIDDFPPGYDLTVIDTIVVDDADQIDRLVNLPNLKNVLFDRVYVDLQAFIKKYPKLEKIYLYDSIVRMGGTYGEYFYSGNVQTIEFQEYNYLIGNIADCNICSVADNGIVNVDYNKYLTDSYSETIARAVYEFNLSDFDIAKKTLKYFLKNETSYYCNDKFIQVLNRLGIPAFKVRTLEENYGYRNMAYMNNEWYIIDSLYDYGTNVFSEKRIDNNEFYQKPLSKYAGKNYYVLLPYQLLSTDDLTATNSIRETLKNEYEAKKLAEEKAKLEAELKARQEAEEKAKQEAEEKQKEEIETEKFYGEYFSDNKLKYSWTMYNSSGEIIDIDEKIDTKMLIDESENNTKIINIINEKQKTDNIDEKIKILTFKHSGDLNGTAHIYVYVGDKFTSNTKLILYYYNPRTNVLENVNNRYEVTVDNDGYVSFDLAHCSEYVLVTEDVSNIIDKEVVVDDEVIDNVENVEIEESNNNVLIIIIVIGLVIILTILSILLYKKFKLKK